MRCRIPIALLADNFSRAFSSKTYSILRPAIQLKKTTSFAPRYTHFAPPPSGRRDQFWAPHSWACTQCRAQHTARPAEPLAVMDNGASAEDLLTFSPDAYGGVIVDASQLPKDPSQFAKRLQATLQHWRHTSVKGVWLQLHIKRANLINLAISQGFIFHHAEPSYVMLTHWLPTETESTLPANPSHQVGVGAFCMNEHQEVLVVQEAHGPLRGKGVWKMPTGLVNAGEDLHEAIVREVLEETGVRTKFEAVLCARQSHGVGMGRDKSDLFFVCAIRPEPGQKELVPQASELAAATWLPLQEFGALEFLRQRPLHAVILDKCLAYARGSYKGLQGFKLNGGLRQESQLLLAGPESGECTSESAHLEEANRL